MNNLSLERRGVLRIRSLTLRLVLLLLLCIPAFNRAMLDAIVPNSWATHLPPPLLSALDFVAYAVVVYAVVVWTFGWKGLTQMVALATVLALTVVLTMAASSKAPLVGEWLQGSKAVGQIDATALGQFFTMLVVIPLGLLVIHSFPPAELISRLRSPAGEVSEWAVKLAILLRIYSIVVEAVSGFYAAWSEENPKVVLPRHRKDIGGTDKLWKLPLWFFGAAGTWGLALVTSCVEQIPQLVTQIDATLPQQARSPSDVQN
jgi:hypothetical protein